MAKLETEAQGLLNTLLDIVKKVTCLLPCQDPYKKAMEQASGTIEGTSPATPKVQVRTDPDVVDNEIERRLGALTVEIKKLKDLALSPHTEENTKRVTVGVVNPIERDGTGPRKVVWMTTVLINPEDGLL